MLPSFVMHFPVLCGLLRHFDWPSYSGLFFSLICLCIIYKIRKSIESTEIKLKIIIHQMQ